MSGTLAACLDLSSRTAGTHSLEINKGDSSMVYFLKKSIILTNLVEPIATPAIFKGQIQ